MDDPTITALVEEVGIQINDAWLLDGVSFACRQGEWTLLDGPSGAGKSTLLRAINGLRTPTRGRIRTLGSPIPGRTRREAREVWRQTGTVLQEVALFETKTACQNVELALRSAGADHSSAHASAVEWLERMQLREKLHEFPCSLSGGQCQRIALARALAVRPRLLLLDEPTSALDRELAGVFLEAVKQLVELGTTVVMSSHRVDEIVELCNQRIFLHQGRIQNVEHRPTLTLKQGHAVAAGEAGQIDQAARAASGTHRT